MATDAIINDYFDIPLRSWFVKEYFNKLSDLPIKNKRFFKREAKVNINHPY